MQAKSDTIIRTVLLGLALVNQLLMATGHNVLPVSDDQMATLLSTLFTVMTSLVAWWKNNSFTSEAIAGDNLMNKLKGK